MEESFGFMPSRDLCPPRSIDLASKDSRLSVLDGLTVLSKALGISGDKRCHPLPEPALNVTGDSGDDAAPPRQRDTFELRYARGWLTRLISELSYLDQDDSSLQQEIEGMFHQASELLSTCAGKMASGPSTLTHTFSKPGLGIKVPLRDASLVHDSLGTHTWGAAPLLCQLILPLDKTLAVPQNILELGAGTGLVGLAVAQWLDAHLPHHQVNIFATDYHPVVMENLAHNSGINGWDQDGKREGSNISVHVRTLDWQQVHEQQEDSIGCKVTDRAYRSTAQTLPSIAASSERLRWQDSLDMSMADKFDMLMVADCIYDPEHPLWIRSVAERFLQRSQPDERSTMHIMVPLRPTHQEELAAIYRTFPKAASKLDGETPKLQILDESDFFGYDNFGSPDILFASNSDTPLQAASGNRMVYRWIRIGWVY